MSKVSLKYLPRCFLDQRMIFSKSEEKVECGSQRCNQNERGHTDGKKDPSAADFAWKEVADNTASREHEEKGCDAHEDEQNISVPQCDIPDFR